MATQKPISTISYNTESFLKEKLDNWINAHIIQAYQYICHKGEDGDKDHIHLRVEPNKQIDPMSLTEYLKEHDLKHPEKPLGVRPWRPSKEEDWYLYAVHDKAYLDWKYGGGEKGEKLPYDWHNIKVSPDYDLEIAFIRAQASMQHSAPSLVKRIQNGEKAFNLIQQGENVFTINAVQRALSSFDYGRLQQAYDKLQVECNQAETQLEKLQEAIDRCGFIVVVDEFERFSLERKPFEKK